VEVSEFDQFADEYLATHAGNLKLSGESPAYFARYKIETLRRRWRTEGLAAPGAILDFGTGIGNSLPHFAEMFPGAALTGVDVSEKSLDLARRRFPGVGTLIAYDGTAPPPLPPASFDLVFSACVFHHIPAAEHAGIFANLRGLLRPGGVLAIFEHNPINPVTRHVVATCPFDANAVLLPARRLRRIQAEAGFRHITVTYTAFLPGALRALRPLERWLGPLPLGAQYYTFARA
jgi:SAM-dependent methyltransferase